MMMMVYIICVRQQQSEEDFSLKMSLFTLGLCTHSVYYMGIYILANVVYDTADMAPNKILFFIFKWFIVYRAKVWCKSRWKWIVYVWVYVVWKCETRCVSCKIILIMMANICLCETLSPILNPVMVAFIDCIIFEVVLFLAYFLFVTPCTEVAI